MADTKQHQDAPGAKEIADALALAAAGIRKKLIARLDQRLERSPLLAHAAGQDIGETLARAARSVHPELEPLARQLGRLLALGPEAIPAAVLRTVAQAGLQRTAQHVGTAARSAGRAADLAGAVRRHPIAAVLAAVAAGFLAGRSLR